MQKRYVVRAALGACVLVAVAACVSKGEFTALQDDFKKLQENNKRLEQRLNAASGGPGDASLQLQLQHIREDEKTLETKYNGEPASPDAGTLSRVGQDKFDNALKLVQKKLTKEGGPPPPLGSVTFNCHQTICQGKSTHPSAESYKAFVLAAFGGGPDQYHAWYSFTLVEGRDAGLERSTTFYTGVPTPLDLDGGPGPKRSPQDLEGKKGPKR
jgi:hypothetical protein